jgi:hypothetical protein
MGVLQAPCQGQLTLRHAQLVGNGLEPENQQRRLRSSNLPSGLGRWGERAHETYLEIPDLLDRRIPVLIAILPTHVDGELIIAHLKPTPLGRRRRSIIILPAQQTHLQRAESGQAQADTLIQPLELALDLPPLQDIVARLLHNGPDQPQLLGDAYGLADLVGTPLRRAPVQRLSEVDDVVEGSHRLLHRRQAVRPVRVHDVHVGELEARERGYEAFEDVFAGEPVVVDENFAVGATPVQLCVVVSKPGPSAAVGRVHGRKKHVDWAREEGGWGIIGEFAPLLSCLVLGQGMRRDLEMMTG